MKMGKKQIIIDSLLTTYYEDGPSTGTPLLFLHGWGSNSALWFQSVAPLSSTRRMLFLDLPGFGNSDSPHDAWDISRYALFVRQFLHKIHVPAVVGIGHSFGGSVLLRLANMHPHEIKKIILVDSAGIRSSSPKKRVMRAIAAIVKPLFRIPPFIHIRKALYAKLGSDYLEIPHMQETYKRIISEDLTGELNSIQQATDIIWGQTDTDTPLTSAKLFASRIPHASLHVIADAGHFPFLDQPQRFLAILRDSIA